MPLQDEIANLLRQPERGAGAPSLAAVESTLTDGYARALALEAERLRIERRLGEVARSAGRTGIATELATLSRRLESADGELASLKGLLQGLQARRRALRRAS